MIDGRGREPERGGGGRGRGGRARPRRARAPRGSRRASSGWRSSGRRRCRALKREHLGIDEATDVLSFPIDGRDELPDGVPRALGDVVLCPQVVGEAWRAPLDARAAAPARLRPRRRDGGAGARPVRRARLAALSTAAGSRRRSPRRRRAGARHAARLVQLRLRGDHPRRCGRSGTCGSTSSIASLVLVAGDRGRRDQARADRAPDRDHVRPDRRDDQHRDRGRRSTSRRARSTRWRSSRRTSPRAPS